MLKRFIQAIKSKRTSKHARLEAEQPKALVRMIATTHTNEIGCGECFEQLDRFAEMTLIGKSAAEAMPLVEDHLRRCGDCREEYEALLDALRAVK